MLLTESLERRLDSLLGVGVYAFGRVWPAFHVCGLIGLALAVSLALALVWCSGLSPLVIVGLALTALLASFGLALISKIASGEEHLSYYRHEFVVLLSAAAVLRLFGQPLLPYLDVTILGLGTFLACGRVGCLMVGCCHGRSYRWGVHYRAEHAAAGFTPYYVGVPLFPIQAVESVWVFSLVLVGSALVLRGYPPGTALAWYVLTYGLGRFCFEFMRGDPERLYLWGFSEAQWTSLILMCGVVWAGQLDIFPFSWWCLGVTAGLVVAMSAVAIKRHFAQTPTHRLLHPRHVKEIAEVVEQISVPATEVLEMPGQVSALPPVRIGRTSLGIQVSAGKIRSSVGDVDHYALSTPSRDMTFDSADALARLIVQMRHASGASEFVVGHGGVFHLLIHPPDGASAARVIRSWKRPEAPSLENELPSRNRPNRPLPAASKSWE